MSTEQGLRERKKAHTRRAIAEAAQKLFAERGFENVTVAEVAREADVSEGTVFNYFPTKEELFYSGMEAFEAALVDAVRDRPAGESVLEAFRRFVLERSRGLEAQERADVIVTAGRIINASPTLQARVRASVLDGLRGPKLAAYARSQGRRAFARLERGLGDYDVKKR